MEQERRMEIDFSTRPKGSIHEIIEWQEKQVEKLTTDGIRSKMRLDGIDEDSYESLKSLADVGAGLDEYLVYAVELGDSNFQSLLMHDMTTRGKDLSIEAAPEAIRHYQRIIDSGFEGYKRYLRNGNW